MCACIVLWCEPPFVATGRVWILNSAQHACCVLVRASHTNTVTQVFVHSPHHRHVDQGGGGRLTASATDTDVRLLSIGQHIMVGQSYREVS